MKKRKLEYIKIEKIEKALDFCRENNNTMENGGCKDNNTFYFESGAWDVIEPMSIKWTPKVRLYAAPSA